MQNKTLQKDNEKHMKIKRKPKEKKEYQQKQKENLYGIQRLQKRRSKDESVRLIFESGKQFCCCCCLIDQ